MKENRYNDHVTRVTDPFYACRCPEGHAYWSVTYTRRCRKCGRKLESCLPAGTKKAASAN